MFGGNGAPNGTGSATSPTQIAIGAADHVLVLKHVSWRRDGHLPHGEPSTAEDRIQELSRAGTTLLDTHMACNGLNEVSGIAYDSATGPSSPAIIPQLVSGQPLSFKRTPVEPPSATLDSLAEISSTG